MGPERDEKDWMKVTADMEARLQALELAEQERVRQVAAAAEVVRMRAGEERKLMVKIHHILIMKHFANIQCTSTEERCAEKEARDAERDAK
jgi:uncharacterized membrane protein